jgi:hypothetical protein
MRRSRLWIVLVVFLVFGLVTTQFSDYPVLSTEKVEALAADPEVGTDDGDTEVIVIDYVEETSPNDETLPNDEAPPSEGALPNEVALPGEDTSPSEVETIEEEKKIVSQLDLNEDGYEVLERYGETLPDGLILDLDYTDYWISPHYIVVLSGSVNIRQGPSTEFEIIKRGYYGEKYSLSEKVRGEYFSKSESDEWYKIYWWENGEQVNGYVYAPIVNLRRFRFDTMFERVTDLKVAVDATDTGYIYNVGNSNGLAPLYKGAYSRDEFGVPRYQGAPAYYAPDWDSSHMRYMQDGLLLAILEDTGKFYKVNAYDYEGEYYVPKRYVSRRNSIESLTQVIVVDIQNQNEGIFEYRDGIWHLISYSYATTGADTKYKEPTIPASYQIIAKQDYFKYKDDITKIIAGYAPYALRFNGGAFVHGVPVNYKLVRKTFVIQEEIKDEEGNIIQKEITEQRIVDKIDPGQIEYMGSLGTIPLSHKCVRNITSHAKFLYDWVVLGKASVVVID